MIEKGIYFGSIHSFTNLNLILSKVESTPAEPKTDYVDIPGGDGSIDMTEAHGEVKFHDRTLKFTFTMRPNDPLTWEGKQRQVSNALNGRRFERITIDDDPDYYWTGRVTVVGYAANKKIRQIVVSVRVKPYKMRQDETVSSFTLSSSAKTVSLSNGRKSVVPTITNTSANAVIVFGGKTITLESAGTHRVLDICLTEGTNSMKVSGSGTLTFTYREGAL